jgi:hypothetical protein
MVLIVENRIYNLIKQVQTMMSIGWRDITNPNRNDSPFIHFQLAGAQAFLISCCPLRSLLVRTPILYIAGLALRLATSVR